MGAVQGADLALGEQEQVVPVDLVEDSAAVGVVPEVVQAGLAEDSELVPVHREVSEALEVPAEAARGVAVVRAAAPRA